MTGISPCKELTSAGHSVVLDNAGCHPPELMDIWTHQGYFSTSKYNIKTIAS